jgi:hypothetical protein
MEEIKGGDYGNERKLCPRPKRLASLRIVGRSSRGCLEDVSGLLGKQVGY